MPKSNTELALEVGRRILKLREDQGWTQEQLADRAGLSQNFIAITQAETDHIQALFASMDDVQREAVIDIIQNIKTIIEYTPPEI